MKHLTQSEYQSLPEQLQCNWKEQWAYRPFGDIEFTLLPSEPNDNAKENYDVQLIYIPITPNLAETLFNAEMGEVTIFVKKSDAIEEVHKLRSKIFHMSDDCRTNDFFIMEAFNECFEFIDKLKEIK